LYDLNVFVWQFHIIVFIIISLFAEFARAVRVRELGLCNLSCV
jgi:hypothetical protein